MAVAKYALRGRERLGMLRVVDDVIAMHGLLWPDEIRAPEGVAPDADVKVRDAELDLADALMNTLGDADLETLHDDYREAVEELVAAKAAGEPVTREAAEEPEGKVIDLMAALENSVRAAEESHGEDGGVADVHPIGSGGGGGAKRSGAASKKAPARRTGPGKTAMRQDVHGQGGREQGVCREDVRERDGGEGTGREEPEGRQAAREADNGEEGHGEKDHGEEGGDEGHREDLPGRTEAHLRLTRGRVRRRGFIGGRTSASAGPAAWEGPGRTDPSRRRRCNSCTSSRV